MRSQQTDERRLRGAGLESPARCVIVWVSASGALGLLAALFVLFGLLPLATQGDGARHATSQGAVTSALHVLGTLAGLAACGVLWWTISTVCWGLLRGHPTRADGLVRRLALSACGVGLVLGTASPTLAADLTGLDGLPHPERPSIGRVVEPTPAAQPETALPPRPAASVPSNPSRSTGDRHTVAAGDNLWSIASRRAPNISAAEVASLVRSLHRANVDVVGTNPDLIHPGQVLDLSPLDRAVSHHVPKETP